MVLIIVVYNNLYKLDYAFCANPVFHYELYLKWLHLEYHYTVHVVATKEHMAMFRLVSCRILYLSLVNGF